MHPLPDPHRRLSLSLFVSVVAFAWLCALPAAFAAPATTPSERPAPAKTTVVARGTVGSATVSIESSEIAIALGRPLSVGMRARLSSPASSVQMRLKVMRSTGRIIFQRTRASYDVAPGDVYFSFGRETGDLDLKSGAYPVELTTRISAGGRVSEETIHGDLLVFDPKAQPVPVTLVARVSAAPLSDPQGRFTADPGSYTRARDEVQAVSEYVLAHPNARLTLAVAPVLLEEWKRIAAGYEVAAPEGVTAVPAEAPSARAYAIALERLDSALHTGRLELLSLGYSDPNVAELAANNLLADVAPQYARGLSSVYTALEATPSAGTIPAGGCVPPSAADELEAADVRYAIVRPHCTRDGETTATSGAYRVSDSRLVALVGDEPAARLLSSGVTSGVTDAAFRHYTSADASAPLTVVVTVGPGRTTARTSLLEAADALLVQPWARLATAGQSASSPTREIELVSTPKDRNVPAGYWAEVTEARAYADGLSSITTTADANAEQAQRDSLLAESAAWSGNDGAWALADRGRTFAAASVRTSKSILDSIRLSVEPVTLSGSRGDVPVSVVNGSGKDLTVRLVTRAPGSLELVNDPERKLPLKPRENFVEIPVDLVNSLSGDLTVAVMAGDLELDRATVTVRASYLDRLALIGGLVALLGIGLAFIIRRVRGAEAATLGEPRPDARYTEPQQVDEDRGA